MDRQDQSGQRNFFVNIRQAGIDHQKICPLLLLFDGQFRGIVVVAGAKGFLQFFPPGGVDPFAYSGDGILPQFHHSLPAAQPTHAVWLPHRRNMVFQ